MNDTLEPQLHQLLQQLQQLIRCTAQEAAEESSAQLHKQLAQFESQLDTLLQDQRTLQDLNSRTSSQLQELSAGLSRFKSLRGDLAQTRQDLAQTRGDLEASQAQVQTEVAKLQSTLEQQLQLRQQRFAEFQQVQTNQFQNLEQQLADVANLVRESAPRSTMEQALQTLQTEFQQRLTSLDEQIQERWNQNQSGLTRLTEQISESNRQQAELTKQIQELRKILDLTIRDHHANQADAAKQLKEAREHIMILNDQILSQARVLSDAEVLRQKLQSRLQSLEAQLAQESLKPRGLLGWLSGS